jgi:GNAT superfamily N-acetyltransferase
MSFSPILVLTDVPDPALRTWIAEGLAESNRAHVREPGLQNLVLVLKHPGDGRRLGALWGRTAWDWLLIELLFVAREMRGLGWGRRLVAAAEQEAIRRNCRGAWVDTYTFQAPGFYERLGYAVFGTLEDYPAGHRRFFLQKKLIDLSDPPSSADPRI